MTAPAAEGDTRDGRGVRRAVAHAAGVTCPAWAVDMSVSLYLDAIRRELTEVGLLGEVAKALARVADGERR